MKLRGCRGCVHPPECHIRLFRWTGRGCLVCPCSRYRAEWSDPLLLSAAASVAGICASAIGIVSALVLHERPTVAIAAGDLAATVIWQLCVLLLVFHLRWQRRLLTRELSRELSRDLPQPRRGD